MFKSKCQEKKTSQESCEKQVGKVEQIFTIIIFSFFISKWNCCAAGRRGGWGLQCFEIYFLILKFPNNFQSRIPCSQQEQMPFATISRWFKLQHKSKPGWTELHQS